MENAGQVNITGIGGIASLLVEPDLKQALIIDNLAIHDNRSCGVIERLTWQM